MSFEPDGVVLAARDDADFMIQATGYPRAGVIHAEAAIAAGKHVVMVNVEADAMVGPLLTKKPMLQAFAIQSHAETNLHWCPKWLIGHELQDSMLRLQERARSIYRCITI